MQHDNRVEESCRPALALQRDTCSVTVWHTSRPLQLTVPDLSRIDAHQHISRCGASGAACSLRYLQQALMDYKHAPKVHFVSSFGGLAFEFWRPCKT